MFIFKNAFVSITRNKSRNILIGIIVMIVSCCCAVTLAIKNSANTLIESYQNKYDTLASIGVNRENMMGKMKPGENMSESDRDKSRDDMIDTFNEISNISIIDIEKYGDSEYVKEYYYNMSIGVNSDDIEKVSMQKSDEESNEMPGGGMRGPGGKENFMNISSSDFTLIGYSSYNGMLEFISGKYSISDGKISDDLNKKTCIINSELAVNNDIEVGDKIVLVDPDDEDNEIELEVTGIYEETSDNSDMMGMFTSSVNTIITNTTVVNEMTKANEDMKVTTTPTFILTSKDVIEDFTSEVTEKGLSEYLTVSTNLDEVNASTETISNVRTFASTFLIMTFIIGAIVLFVINMINIRERKYEIGVLRTIGMKKSLLSLQFISELLMVSFVSLILGACIGSFVSVPISNNLLENEIETSKEKMNEIGNNFGRGPGNVPGDFEKISGVVKVAEINEINAIVDIKVLFELLGIGLLLTILSSSASMISIQKFSPLSILKERT